MTPPDIAQVNSFIDALRYIIGGLIVIMGGLLFALKFLWSKLGTKEEQLAALNKDLVAAESRRGEDMKQLIRDTTQSDHVVADALNSMTNALRESQGRGRKS